MRERLGWVVLALLALVVGYGFVVAGMRPETVWSEGGWQRFLMFGGLFGVLALGGRWGMAAAVVAVAGFGMWRVGPVAVLAPAYLLGAFWLTGGLVAPRARGWMALLLGMGVWIFVIGLAVHFRVNSPLVYFVAAGVPYGLGWRRIRFAWPERVGWQEGLLLFLLLAHFVVAVKPETGADALAVHMTAPALIAHEGWWAFDYQRFAWALMPLGADWVFTAGYLLGGEAGARLLNFGVLVVLVGLIRDTAGRYVGAERATLGAALFASTPLVQLVTGSLFVENVWAAVVVGAVVAAIDGELLWAGALLGTGMAVKVGTSAFLVPVILAGVVAGKRRELVGMAGLVVLLGSPGYLNAWWRTGNPVYPYMNHVFKAATFDSSAPFGEFRFREPLRWTTPYGLTFRSADYYEGEKGGMGFQYLLLVAPAVFFLRERRARMLAGVGLAAAVTLYLSQPNIRYLYPALALLSATLAALPAGWGLAGVAALNILFLPAAGYAHREFALVSATEEAAYTEVGFPQRALIGYLNAQAPGETVAFFGGNAVLGLWGRAYTDQWHSYPYSRELEGVGTARALRDSLRRLGVRYVVAPGDGVTKYPAANVLLRPLLGAPVMRSGRFSLFLLPDAVGEDLLVDGVFDAPGEAFAFTGKWSHNAEFPEALGGTLSYSDVSGSSVVFGFRGTGVEVLFTRAFNRGEAVVLIDGVERGRVNQYGAETRWRESWRVEGLAAGAHRLEVRVVGNGFVDVDGVRVVGD